MSFDKITKGYQPRSKKIVIEHNGEKLEFTAKEISFIANAEIAVKREQGLPWVAEYIVASVVDSDGKSMTINQAEALPKEYADKFLSAVAEVNKQDLEKN